jgi:hypothetical protein
MEITYDPTEGLTPAGYHISPALLKSGSPLLPKFMERVIQGVETTVEGLRRSDSPKLSEFLALQEELNAMEAQL